MFIISQRVTKSLFLGIASAMLLWGCGDKTPTVSFQNDVKPVLDLDCLECHERGTEGYEASGLSLETYEDLMRGTKFGPVVIPGDSLTSALTMLLEGRADPSIAMPHGKRQLRQEDIDKVNAWIDQGAEDN